MNFNYSVKVYPFENPQGKMLANAEVIIEEVFCVKNFRIGRNERGFFVLPPSSARRNKDGVIQKNDKGGDIYDSYVSFLEPREKGGRGEAETEIFDEIIRCYHEAVKTKIAGAASQNNTATTAPAGRAGAAKRQAEALEAPSRAAPAPAPSAARGWDKKLR